MKKRNAFILIAVLMLPFAAVFTGCKKGEKDPFISFRSRKGRMAGEWTMSSYNEVYKSTSNNITTTITTTADGTNRTETVVVGSSTGVTTTWAHTQKWELRKDGTYSITITDSTSSFTMEGKWDFTQGIGKDTKKKEQVVLYLEKYTSGSSTTTYTGTANTEVYDIYQLKNKEIILKRDGTFSDSGDYEELTSEMTLTQ